MGDDKTCAPPKINRPTA